MEQITPATPPNYLKAALICIVAPVLVGGGAQLIGVFSGEPASGPSTSAAQGVRLDATSEVQAARTLAMGTLRSPEYQIDVISTAAGPRYTVRNRHGSVVAVELTPEQAAVYFDGQDPRTLITAETLMLADDRVGSP